MSFYTLAISSSNHNSSICLLKDNEIVVSFPCERINRDKYTQRVKQQDIDVIARYTKCLDLVVLVNIRLPTPDDNKLEIGSFETSEQINDIKQRLSKAGIVFEIVLVDNSNHHLYHAAAGFYASGFDEALCLIIDGIGTKWVAGGGTLSETTTIFHVAEKFQTLHKNLFYTPCGFNMTGWHDGVLDSILKTFSYPAVVSPHVDIGKMYGTVTRHIGFRSSNEAGKTMGLAAYGIPNDLPEMLIKDSYISDANVFRNDSQLNTFLHPSIKNPDEQTKRNLAYNVQKALETIFIKRVEQALSIKQSNNIVIGGGCALNILGNSIIKKTFPHLNVFVEPIGNDVSQSVGAALYHYKRLFPNTKFTNLNTLYYGPGYSIVDTKDKLLKLVEQYNNESNLPV